jgi:predicted RNase H-like HicB family nuclease
MRFDDYKVVLYGNQPHGWVAEVPAIRGCYALMPIREEALAELAGAFEMIAAEYDEKGLSLPADSTAIVKCRASAMPNSRGSAEIESLPEP